jgi:hypothetical protein
MNHKIGLCLIVSVINSLFCKRIIFLFALEVDLIFDVVKKSNAPSQKIILRLTFIENATPESSPKFILSFFFMTIPKQINFVAITYDLKFISNFES